MKKLLILCFLAQGCAVLGPKSLQGFWSGVGRGLASAKPGDLFCKRLRISLEEKDKCSKIAQEVSDSVLSICANLETSPKQKVNCVEGVAGKEIDGAVVSATANWQASPDQTIHFLEAVAGKEVSSFAVTMCEKLWKTAQQRMDCVLESISSPSSVPERSYQNQDKK